MDNNSGKSVAAPLVIIVPTPGMGHLIPIIQFAKRFLQFHNFSFTFIVPTYEPPSAAMKSTVAKLPPQMSALFLPPVSLNDLPADMKPETLMSQTVARSLPALRQEMDQLSKTKDIAALIFDLFATDAIDVALEFHIKPYLFFPSTAMCLSVFLHLPELDKAVSCEFRDMDELVRIPGCIGIHGGELLYPLQDRKDDAYKWCLYHGKRYRLAEGIIVNSFSGVESNAIKALQAHNQAGMPPVYPIGPITQVLTNGNVAVEESDCLKWLDNQPPSSVLFISFGSVGVLSQAQLNELAFGLEMSEQRFIWVVRSPKDTPMNTLQSSSNPMEYLPEGFLERTKGCGFVIPNWAPQAQILSHSSTGGFMSHCGWNSTLESVVNGVPIIAWPIYAEQKMNAALLTRDVKIALRPARGEDGVIGRGEITRVVKSLMEGEEGKMIRNRVRGIKDEAVKVLGKDGTSTKALSEIAFRWKLSS